MDSIAKDIQKLRNILKWLEHIKLVYTESEILNPNVLKNNIIAQAALTQFITNIYEDKKKLSDETFNKLSELNKIKLAQARNIASHDYDSVDFGIIYAICKKLIAYLQTQEIGETLRSMEGSHERD